MLADALGLNAVHVTRTPLALRRQGDLKWRGREVILPSAGHFRRTMGRREAPRRPGWIDLERGWLRGAAAACCSADREVDAIEVGRRGAAGSVLL